MRAAVCRAFGSPLSIEEVEIGDLQPTDVHVEIVACAVCHSDIHFAEGAWGGVLPSVYGHEAAGVVVAVGSSVTHAEVGDRVVVTLIRSCGACEQCQRGNEVFCDASFTADGQSRLVDASGTDLNAGMLCGAFAEEVVVDQSQVVPVPADLPFEVASLLACGVITGVGAVMNTSSITEGCDVIVIGAGGVGLNAIQGAAIAGARSVIALDLAPEKLDIARRFGATHVANPLTDDVEAVIAEATGGKLGVTHVLVTVGSRAAIESAMDHIVMGGEVVIVGMPAVGQEISLDPVDLAAYGHRVIGSKMGTSRIREDIPRLIEWYREGKLLLDELISGTYPLDDINEAIDAVSDGAVIRNVITMRG